MNIILKSHYPISLGFNCSVKHYLDRTFGPRETGTFDWLGTSMWALDLMFREDFAGAFDADKYTPMQILTTGRLVNTHPKYYIVAKHDNMDKTLYAKYQRRLSRLRETLTNTETKVLFIRLEEYRKHRIIYDQYKEYYAKDEVYYIKNLICFLGKQYPNLKFTFILISWTLNTDCVEHMGHKIIIIKAETELGCAWDSTKTLLDSVFTHHAKYLTEQLTEDT
jgi:hypothetical protein